MFPEYVAYLAAERAEEMTACSALPDAPTVIDDEPRVGRARFAGVRRWISADLRRLADRLDPSPRRPLLATAQRQ